MNENVIEVFSPIDGSLIKAYPVSSEQAVADCVMSARVAAKHWREQDIKQRLICLAQLKNKLVSDVDSITELLVRVTGKVKTEVLLGEIYPLLEMLQYYQKNAPAILAPQNVSTSPLVFPGALAHYQYYPYGVVAVISPWNFPFQLTLYPLLSALIAGNAVVFKTSELSLPVAELISDLLAGIGLPDGLVQWLAGGAETGQYLIQQRPDLVFFTGGLQAGRSIMAAAARHPIPVILELGGKDNMLVFADAQMERVINAAMYGAFSNSGQICVSVECLWVEQAVFKSFIRQLCNAAANITIGHGETGDLGALTSPAQQAIIKGHYQDAIAKGAKASGRLQLNGSYMHPLILWDVTEDMRIMQEETFGPLLVVLPFSDVQALIEKLNASEFGLSASIWSSDIEKAETIARQLEVGSWAVNDVIKNVGHPRLPFGGVKNSGFGRYHGADGLRSFTYTVSGVVSRSQFVREPNWFPYSECSYRQMRAFIDVLFAADSLSARLKRNWRELRAFQDYAGLNLRQHWRNLIIFIGRKQN